MKQYLELTLDFSRRLIEAKYRTSYLGLLWALLTPLLILGVYTLAFSVILGADKLSASYASPSDYVVTLFAGLTIFFFFSEIVSTSPDLISKKSNFVKKVIFPLPVLVFSQVVAAAFTLMINIGLLLLFIFINNGALPITALFLPIILFPIFLFTLGMAFALSALGVYLPDIKQITSPLTRMLFYLTPIVYSIGIVPEAYRPLFWLNPMTSMVQHLQAILPQGQPPDWESLAYFYLAAVAMLIIGFWLFSRLKSGFADVI